MKKIPLILFLASSIALAGGSGAGDPKCKECQDALNEGAKARAELRRKLVHCEGELAKCEQLGDCAGYKEHLAACRDHEHVLAHDLKECQDASPVPLPPQPLQATQAAERGRWFSPVQVLGSSDGWAAGAGVGYRWPSGIALAGNYFYMDHEGCGPSAVRVSERAGMFTGSHPQQPTYAQCPGCEIKKDWLGVMLEIPWGKK